MRKEKNDPFGGPYDPTKNEENLYTLWLKNNIFAPESTPKHKKVKPFSMVLPPPNVTGILHIGHASIITIQDIIIRYHRMRGERTLWIPGTDHAAIATQSKVEKEIYKKEGKTRHNLGREELLKRINAFAQESHDTIVKQIKRLGASLDWSREAFTLDEKRTKAVQTAFKKMYDAGLIYRKNKIINWDPKLQTTLSDEEVEYQEEEGVLYTFYYHRECPIPIATTRPETKLGDTAIAVHPDDKRYKNYVGKTFIVPFCGEQLTLRVVADMAVDPNFGTGAVGITPAHSVMDYEIAERHNLDLKQVINEYGKISVGDHDIAGKNVKKARELIVEKLKKQNLLLKQEKIVHSISRSQRSGAIIENLPKLQWFVSVNTPFTFPGEDLPSIPKGTKITIKEYLKKVVDDGYITFTPPRFTKIYFQWVENLRDWCISRQLWYGHRIPVWYQRDNQKDEEKIYCGTVPPTGEGWQQDPDTLDTWFSSGLWTFATLGWPEKTEDLKEFHPNSLLQTAYDIIFFWVARMILMTGFLLGDIPFPRVYLSGLVRDEKGKKMSKSSGNIIDPLVMIERYGADALRMALIVGAAPGNDISLSEGKIKGYKHFTNKVWNAARFLYLEKQRLGTPSHNHPLTPDDQKKLDEFYTFAREVTNDIENYRLHVAAEKLYHYFWHTFADVMIEETKKILRDPKNANKNSSLIMLEHVLNGLLILLHPFIPFVTESIWQKIKPAGAQPLLATMKWPV